MPDPLDVEWTICEGVHTAGEFSGIILGMGSVNERRRHSVTSSLIGWAHTQNDPS